MPTPSECKPIADAIAKLHSQENAKRVTIPALTGVAKWKAMQDLGDLRQQIKEQQTLLDECEKRHAADLATEIVVIDVPGISGPNRMARVWQLTPTGQTVKQTATVQKGVATFSGILGSARQSIGITIEETDHPDVTGPDFRSGPLPSVPEGSSTDPASRVEIVILDPITIGDDTMSQAIPHLPIQLSYSAGAIGAVNIAVTTLQFVVASGTVSISASGTASAVGMSSPFTFSDGVHISPMFCMAPSLILEVALGASPSLTMPGIVGSLVQELRAFLSSNLLGITVQPLGTLLNKMVATLVSTALGLRLLPSGSVLSVRQLTMEANKITITPVLAAFGKVLSDFQPPPPDAATRLVTLDVQPASISTSDPANRVAQGRVTLSGPASAGGVTVALWTDRTDVTRIDPASLVIPEGATGGTFTVTGVGQALMPVAHIDASIKGALGDQTLIAPISIRPETPTTSPEASASQSFVTAETHSHEQDILVVVNQYRAALQLPTVVTDESCATEARCHSVDMAAGRVPLGSDGFQERFARIGAATGHPGAAELHAAGQQSASQLVKEWLTYTDAKNQSLIYGPYSRGGVGVAKSQGGLNYVTIIFS